jgi:beta-phosphoglucomutase-like phosphatase (HAD superfamily)
MDFISVYHGVSALCSALKTSTLQLGTLAAVQSTNCGWVVVHGGLAVRFAIFCVEEYNCSSKKSGPEPALNFAKQNRLLGNGALEAQAVA